jgi:methylated-DNA-[protein]-cysteine S-methyltransferase
VRESLLYTTIASPIGGLLLLGDGSCLRGLYMQEGRKPAAVSPGWRREPGAFAAAKAQLDEYFAGRRTGFDLALEAIGTPFQRRVWGALGQVGYGETLSYGELARRLGRPRAARAVGAANGSNPISIVIPCHRLIGAGGAMTGYAGGVEAKRSLLDLESAGRRRSPSPTYPAGHLCFHRKSP